MPRPDYIYAVNLLYQLGIRARVDFIRTTGGMTYIAGAVIYKMLVPPQGGPEGAP